MAYRMTGRQETLVKQPVGANSYFSVSGDQKDSVAPNNAGLVGSGDHTAFNLEFDLSNSDSVSAGNALL
jgi:hypothetical protein